MLSESGEIESRCMKLTEHTLHGPLMLYLLDTWRSKEGYETALKGESFYYKIQVDHNNL